MVPSRSDSQIATADLETGSLSIPNGLDSLPCYFARPKNTAGPRPCVIVVHEIFGVHEYIRDVCRRLAHEGYYAITVDLFARYGDATGMTDFKQIYADIVLKTSMEQIFRDLDACVAYLEQDRHADSHCLGMTGFCWGGNITWMYASRAPRLKAGVAWYGRLKGDLTPSQQQFPLDVVQDLAVPVLGLYGAEDASIPLYLVDQMRELLNKGKSGSDIKVFPHVGHAFHAYYRPTYDEHAAKEGWADMLNWFRKHGLG